MGSNTSHLRLLFGVIFLAALAFLSACTPDPEPCNGGAELCDRAFDEVAYATTHNAMSNRADGWDFPNQEYTVTSQLQAGIRGLMLDTYMVDGVPTLCHGFCSLGSTPLVDTLGEIEAFLDAQPDQVVTIIFESYIDASETAAAFDAAGLTHRVATPVPGQPWPTLGELIAANTQLVVFHDRATDPNHPWLANVWDHSWETHFAAETPADFSCAPNRGNQANELFILNHFLTNLIGSRQQAEQVNHNPFLIDRALQCQAESGALPNFVTVDFYDIGDVMATVNQLNGVSE